MKRLTKLFPLMMLLLVLGSCSSIRVSSDYDKQVNFENYKTYNFLTDAINKLKLNSLDRNRILNSIEYTLTTEGYQKVESNPDFVVNIYTKAEKKVNVVNTNNFYGGYGYYGWGSYWGPYWGPTQTYVTTNIEGTLYIDILDAKTKTLVWQGVGSGYLDKNASTNEKEQTIQAFVQKILAQFPPKIKK